MPCQPTRWTGTTILPSTSSTTGFTTITFIPTTTTTYTCGGTVTWYPPITPPDPTPEERAEFTRQRDEREEAERTRRTERDAATVRAEELLLTMLDDVQRASYLNIKVFEVIGSLGGRYRIRPGTIGNVDALTPEGQIIGSLCCHPLGGLPLPDVALAQMLHITTDEGDFVRTANVQRGRRPTISDR